MEEESTKFRCTGKWNGEDFDRVIKAGNDDARDR